MAIWRKQQAEPRMHDLKGKAEATVAEFGVNDRESARREPARQRDAMAEHLEEIARAAKISASSLTWTVNAMPMP